jgi:hypothetical protein
MSRRATCFSVPPMRRMVLRTIQTISRSGCCSMDRRNDGRRKARRLPRERSRDQPLSLAHAREGRGRFPGSRIVAAVLAFLAPTAPVTQVGQRSAAHSCGGNFGFVCRLTGFPLGPLPGSRNKRSRQGIPECSSGLESSQAAMPVSPVLPSSPARGHRALVVHNGTADRKCEVCFWQNISRCCTAACTIRLTRSRPPIA